MTLKEFDRRLTLLFKQIDSSDFRERIALEVIRIVKARVKSGFGVDDDGKSPAAKVKLKPLSQKYIERRKNKTLGEFGSPGKSNLTMTGEMLKSMTYDVVKEIRVYIPDTTRKDGESNADVAFFASFDRPFMALTDSELKVITKLYERRVRELIRRYF